MKKINLACLIEDDDIQLYITKTYIEMSGYVENVMVCKDGKEAYDTFVDLINNNKELPQIIFLDLNMPIWDGWQFLEEFYKLEVKDKITIYILTSSDNEEDINRAKEFNLSNQYLIKPITLEKVNEIVSVVSEKL